MGSSDYLPEPLTEREMDILLLLAEGLTDREIAQKLVIAQGTVKWYNKQIYQKLDVHGRKQAVDRARQAGLLESRLDISEYNLEHFKHNLPAQLTSFVGREYEIAEVKRLLGTTRLLTLTGPPGTGKTRLGLRVAAEVLNQFDDGIYYVELAPISDPALVASTIAQIFGIRETAGHPLLETLKIYLREKRLLLLIDNFEQVIDAAPLVGELLSAAPSAKALVTSREALRVYGEQEYAVPPLTLPDLEHIEPLYLLAQYEAVELFCQRAGAVKSDFSLTEENVFSVSEICARLDGLPLAIELAAARSKLLSPENIRDRLDSRLLTLTGGARDQPARLQTLRAAVDWSYDLLDPVEKTLFARLAVFQGGRSVEAVEAICGHNLTVDILEGLESLLNKSLLGQEIGLDGEPRFVMLEMIHEYARERLDESGEAEEIQRQHATYFLALVEQAAPELRKAGYIHWSLRLRDEHNNLRTALAWSLSGGDAELGLELAGALRDFWGYGGQSAEGLAWTRRALESATDAPPPVRARALNAAGWLSYEQGENEQGRIYNEQALKLFRKLGDEANTAWALVFLSGQFLALPDRITEGLALCKEALALFRSLEDRPGIIFTVNVLGELLRLDGDYERAGRAYEESLTIAREEGDKLRQAVARANLGYVAQHAGDYERAESAILAGLGLLLELENTRYIPQDLAILAGPVAAQGNAEKAARLLGASEALLEKMGLVAQAADQVEIERNEAAVREQLDEAAFEAAWGKGRAMSLEEAVAYALGSEK
jgi:predicted ATPase/DNA-binding CsgD family transcriptional regulator